MLISKKIGMIGTGNMGNALIDGLIQSGAARPENIICSDASKQQLATVKEKHKVVTTTDNIEVVKSSDIIIYAIKPQIMASVLKETADYLDMSKLIISIAAGVTVRQLEQGLGENRRTIRVMPNTPALVLAGASAMSGNAHASRKDMELCEKIFSAVGTCAEVPENLLDAVTGLSGSGPGYVFTFLEAMIDGGVLAGIPRPLAEQLALQTLYGSAKLALASGESAAALKGKVTSPGGTTITGLQVLEQAGLRGTVMAAVKAATDRSRELGS